MQGSIFEGFANLRRIIKNY